MKQAFFLLFVLFVNAQIHLDIEANFDSDAEILKVNQTITYQNLTTKKQTKLYLNDWNYGYSSHSTPFAERFSDEFVRNFHLSKKSERSQTNIHLIKTDKQVISWQRLPKQEDIIEILLTEALEPNQTISLTLAYDLKLPHKKFTGYGADKKTTYYFKNSFITPAKVFEDDFLKHSFLNIDDNASDFFDVNFTLKHPDNFFVFSELLIQKTEQLKGQTQTQLAAKNKNDIPLILSKQKNFLLHKNAQMEVLYNFDDKRLNVIQKALLVDKIVTYVDSLLGKYPNERLLVSQEDYNKNPFYGLNQLPGFLRPFSDEFVFEIKFLKTYLNAYFKSSMRINQREDNWLFDAIQIYCLKEYIKQFYPDEKILGKLSKIKLIKGYHLSKLNFNDQYNYYFLLMARRNQDQAIGENKENLLKFNEQIAGKYRAGLSLKYLDEFLGQQLVSRSLKDFYALATTKDANENDFRAVISSKTNEDLSWFFDEIVNSRTVIDFKVKKITTKDNELHVYLKNKTQIEAPIPLYTLKNQEIVSKDWITFKTDTVITYQNASFDKVAVNYQYEAPEYNQRDNIKSVKKGLFKNRPFKALLFKDLESPYVNQALLIPSFSYNAYNGISLGLRAHNKTFLDKPFRYVINPEYGFGSQDINGGFGFEYNQINRDSNWFNHSYFLSGRMANFAEDAKFYRFSPAAIFRWRNPDFRKNHSQSILARYIMIKREASDFVEVTDQTENYSLLNLRYTNFYDELKSRKSFFTDLQLADIFGKLSVQAQYRKLYSDSRLLSLRFFAGSFLYRNTTSEFFSFGLDRPTDYLFDYNFLGVSETTGLLSQQFVMAEGGLKSFLNTRFANQWMTTFNASFSIWNWIEAYGDIGFLKNQGNQAQFVYDSGIRLNFLPDFFELYFPIYSSNGWEIKQNNYQERIRFVITLEPSRLLGLFTRKWF